MAERDLVMAGRPAGRRRGRLARGGSAGAAIATMLALLAGAPMSAAAASTATAGPAAAAPMRVVQYHGYEITVPASWPVYNLAADPTRCVLFNRHAVYLGTPGANQACPARAYGHTGAVLVQPDGAQGNLPPATVQLPADTAALPTGALPAAAAAAAAAGQVVHVAAPGPGVLVTATYGSDQSQVRTILAGARMTRREATASTTVPRSSQKAVTAANATASTANATASAPQTARPTELVRETGHGLGFDPCTVPSVATMTAWLASPYRVIGTYLGGDNWACSYGNFNPAWVTQVAAEGWQYIPIWVGPQAPCSTIQRCVEDQSVPGRGAGRGRGGERGRDRAGVRLRPRHPDLLRHGGVQRRQHRVRAGRRDLPRRLDAGTARGGLPVGRVLQRRLRHQGPGCAVRQPRLHQPRRHLDRGLDRRSRAHRPVRAGRRLAARPAPAPVLRRPQRDLGRSHRQH